MKSENTFRVKNEDMDDLIDLEPIHTLPKLSAASSTAASGFKRKAPSDSPDDMVALPSLQKQRLSVQSPNTCPTISSGIPTAFSDLSDDDDASPTSGASSERVENRNFDVAKQYVPKAKAPHAPERPITELYIKMVVGPKVEIVVGHQKKSFELPKELLSYYSPVFDRSFNGTFLESQTQKMELPEDSLEDFEVLVEYIFHHGVGDKLSITNYGENTAERCISFLKYADKYDIGDVSTPVYDTLRPALIKYGASAFKPEFIEIVFSLTRDGNCLRQLMVEAALSFQGVHQKNYGMISFEKQESEVEGFESALYRQLRKPGVIILYRPPFDPTGMKSFEK